MKNKKENQQTSKPTVNRKQGKNVKEIVPPSKNAVREMNHFKTPTEFNRAFKPEFEPIDLFPEWPGDEEAKNFEFGPIDQQTENSYLATNQENVFYDQKNEEINLPISLLYYCQNEIKWLRPEQYIREYLVDKEIKNRYPNKNNLKLRKRIKDTFYQMNQDKLQSHNLGETEENQNLNNSNPKNKKSQIIELTLEEKRFRAANKEIFKCYEIPLELKVVSYIDSDAADKEMKETKSVGSSTKNNFGNESNLNNVNNANKAIKDNKDNKDNNKNENKNAAADKNKKASVDNNPILISISTQPASSKIINPANLSLEDRLPNFSKWMTSLMQVIKDLEMFQIHSLIYPQKDGIPVYNPTGRYWVKLFHMGKFRKIEIDDRMPCSKFDEFLLPRSENIEELWPALLTKAIMKLYSYRSNRIKYMKEKWSNEVGDISFLYSLTGYIPEHLNLNFINDDKFDAISNLLVDSRFINHQKYFICYNNYSLESTSTRINYKQNLKILEENQNILTSANTTKNLIDQPFQGLNIFKNYLKNSRANKNDTNINNNNTNFLHTELSLDTNPNQASESLNTLESISETIIPGQIPESSKKSEKFNLHRSSTKNMDLKTKLRTKSKIRAEHKLIPVKEISSPLNTSSTPKNSKNKMFAYNSNINTKNNISLLRLNIKDEIIINKINPISFKDCVENLQKEKEANERLIRLALLGKEKIYKITQNALINISAVESLQISEKEKNAILQVAKINNLHQKQEKIYKESQEFLVEQRIKSIFSDTAYAITDIFFSGDEFNMKRLQPVDFTDLKKKILAAQTNFKLLTAQEKKNYISNLKELKLKHKDEKKQRLLELNQPGEKVYLIKIKNNIKNSLSNFIEKFSNEEIAMTKKCLLNNWRFPPPYYFENTFSKLEPIGNAAKKPDGDTSSDELKYSNSMKLMNTSWTKDFYVNMLKGIIEEPNNLNISHLNNKFQSDEPEIYNNCKEVVERQKDGIWITWSQFLNVFKGFVIVHNPKLYKSIVNVDSNWYNYKSDIYYSEQLAFFLTANSSNVTSIIQNSNNNTNDSHKDNTNQANNAAISNKLVKEDKNAKDAKNNKDASKEIKTENKDKDKDKDASHLHGDIPNNASASIPNQNVISAKYNTDLAFSQSTLPNTKFYNSLTNSCFLIVFEPNTTQNYLFADIKYYIIFDLIAANGRKIFTNIKLTGFFATYQFDEIYFDQDYYLIITGGVHPFGYNLRIMSDHYVETLTNFNYVKKFYGLNQHSISVAFPPIEKNKIFVMGRIKVTNKEKSSFLVNIKQNDGNVDNYLKQFYEVFMVVKNVEKRVYLDKLQDLESSEDPIYLIFTIVPPHSISEGFFDLEFLSSNKNIKIDLIDLVEPYEVSDKYIYNKHGILMKEQIYIPENTNASMEIELKKRSKNYRANSDDKQNDSNSKTIFDGLNDENTLTEFQKLSQSVRLILEIKKDEKQIFSKQFFTKTFISNIELEHSLSAVNVNNAALSDASNTKEKKDAKANNSNLNQIGLNAPFNLILKLDLSECPAELKGEYENPDFEYFWFVRIFATENIAFMKDTTKEEAETALKDSWETRQPGRAERAKLSRKKYLLQVKKQRGELLSAEEENLLNELRNKVYITNLSQQPQEQKKVAADNTKKSANVNAANNNSANSNNNNKVNSNNKAVNKEGNNANANDPLADGFSQAHMLKQSFYARMNKTRTFPKPENHCSLYLKNFLSYVYRDRTIEFNNKTQKKYLDESKIEELSKTVDEKVLEFNNKRKKEELEFNEKKRKMVEESNQVHKKHFMQRRQFSSKLGEIYEAREKISNDYQKQNEKEKNLQEILNGEFDLEKSVQIYKEICANSNDYSKFKNLCVQVFGFISDKKDEAFKSEIKKFNAKDKAPLLKCLEDYKSNNWNIAEDTIRKLNELTKN